MQIIPAGGIIKHGLKRNGAYPKHIHLLIIQMIESPHLFPQHRQTLRRQRKILMHIPAIIGNEMVVQKVFIGCNKNNSTWSAVEQINLDVSFRRHTYIFCDEYAEVDLDVCFV